MILKEENNQEKILMHRVLDVNHEQGNMPSANGKASPWSHSLSGSCLTIQSVWGCRDLSPTYHVGLSGCEGLVSSQRAEGSFDLTDCLEDPWDFPGKSTGVGCYSLLQELANVMLSCFSRVQLFWPHESQHTRPPSPSPTPGVHSNSCPSSRWCQPAISSSVVPFSSCPQSLPAFCLALWYFSRILVQVRCKLPVRYREPNPQMWGSEWFCLYYKSMTWYIIL